MLIVAVKKSLLSFGNIFFSEHKNVSLFCSFTAIKLKKKIKFILGEQDFNPKFMQSVDLSLEINTMFS